MWARNCPPVRWRWPSHDQVGEVGTGQEERSGIGQQNAAVQQRGLALASASGRVHEHRSEERHRGVQIEDRGNGADHDHRPDEEKHAGASGAGQVMAGAGEETVVIGGQADKQEARDQHER